MISIDNEFKSCSLKLFNVKSGDLLSEIVVDAVVNSLAAYPRNRLIAIGLLKDSKDGFKVLKVKLPRDKDSKNHKR